ncbi:hypothetical protein [Nocardiopsis ansamitocini]|uniref:Uncharacterized protein n=1 Tax=Nocardiopsis ansamitocini TaxID=1670832 RepID=A0A9W6P8E2_9ACTN|nr:hypothetical protein [Nocardiopsis ansamitocini]GLU48878.1 hypothetical protein Nans01_32290 [Nocardiopsis ansamitocini]
MTNRGAHARPGGPNGGAGRAKAALAWERAAYWLLYVVALAATLWHWSHDNLGLSVLCLGAVVASMAMVALSSRPPDTP